MNKELQQIIIEALENGTRAMGMMVGPAKLTAVDFYISKKDKEIQYLDTADLMVHLLRTEVVGEFKGASFLALKTIDVYKIHERCLPKSVFESDNPKNRALKGAVLLELDNIVSAAVVTVLANSIDASLYGDVPKLKVTSGHKVNEYLTSEFTKFNDAINVKATIQVDEADMTLSFIWIMEGAFYEAITSEGQTVEEDNRK